VAGLVDADATAAGLTAGAGVPAARETDCRTYLRGRECALVSGSGKLVLARAGDRIAGPPVFVRKAFRMVTSPALFFPSAVVSDYGDAIGADDAAGWIARSGIGYPRAEAQGALGNGSSASCLLRDLDLSEPCLMFAAVQAGEFPGTQVVADLRGIGPDGLQMGELEDAGSAVHRELQTSFTENIERVFGARRNA